VTDAAALEPIERPRVLLAGDVAARPDGLERALAAGVGIEKKMIST